MIEPAILSSPKSFETGSGNFAERIYLATISPPLLRRLAFSRCLPKIPKSSFSCSSSFSFPPHKTTLDTPARTTFFAHSKLAGDGPITSARDLANLQLRGHSPYSQLTIVHLSLRFREFHVGMVGLAHPFLTTKTRVSDAFSSRVDFSSFFLTFSCSFSRQFLSFLSILLLTLSLSQFFFSFFYFDDDDERERKGEKEQRTPSLLRSFER